MKANEAPEKLYYAPYGDIREDNPMTDNDIEYVRKDVFIEKACDAFCKVCKMPNCGSNECKWISDFKKYIGE